MTLTWSEALAFSNDESWLRRGGTYKTLRSWALVLLECRLPPLIGLSLTLLGGR